MQAKKGTNKDIKEEIGFKIINGPTQEQIQMNEGQFYRYFEITTKLNIFR